MKKMMLAKDVAYTLDCHKTGLNNNVLVVGTSGCGKTRSVVSPNLLEACGSYIISDPKGNLYKKYKNYLERQGYETHLIDFTHPEKSGHYNFFTYIRSQKDIIKISHMLVGKVEGKLDPYWDRASEVLISALISYLYEFREKREQTLENLLTLVSYCHRKENGLSEIDSYMDRASHRDPDSFAVRQYDKLKMAPQKTYESILSTIESKIGIFECDELRTMMASNDLNFDELGKRKIALFVVVSDTDRSMDRLANIFFSQAMMELCYYADNFCKGECLKVPVRFILDDFATNVSIEDFPRMISSIRSRGISVMLMIQAESQLETVYNAGKNTIISNCDTYLYMGGNDVETAKAVAQRCNKPLDQILYMEVGRNWIFRRGQRPINGYNLDLEELEKKYKTETKESQKEEKFEEFR